MPVGSAISMLQQLMQQLQSPGFAQGQMGSLAGAGLGARNPADFFGTPIDEQMLRQAVLGRVLGYYGFPGGIGAAGNPNQIGNPLQNFDPITGGLLPQKRFQQAGFDTRQAWRDAGRPDTIQNPLTPIQTGGMGGSQGIGRSGEGQFNPVLDLPQGPPQIGTGGFDFGPTGVAQLGQFGSPFDFFGMMGGQNPNVPALNIDYGSILSNAMQNAGYNRSSGPIGMPGGRPGFTPPNAGGNPALQGGPTQQGGNPISGQGGGLGFNPASGGISGGIGQLPQQFDPNLGPYQLGGLPDIGASAQNSLNAMFQPQVDQMNLDFNQQKNDLINQMFGTGMNQSSVAADASGKLLYGRSAALNQIMGQKAQAEMALRQQMLDLIAKKGGNALTGGGYGAGGATGGGFVGGGSAQDPSAQLNILAGMLGTHEGGAGSTSAIPLSFDQQMRLADMQLKQAGLQQQGQLGFGQLGLQQLLGLGSQGLQGQGLSQDFMSQLLGMGMQRQQGAAGVSQADLARMQQYLMGQQGLMGQLGSQQAGMEAQRRSLLSQILGGLAGFGSSIAGSPGGFGGFFGDISSIFH